jgi:hypothetical protein
MPASVTITPRLIFQEDLSLTTDYAPTQEDVEIGGLGTVPVTPINAVLYSAFPSYANVTAANTALAAGRIYFDISLGTLAVTTA